MLDVASEAAGVESPGLVAGVEAFAGVFTGDGALGAGVSAPPNEKPPSLAAGVVAVGAGVVPVDSFDASLAASPNENPPEFV